MQTWKKLVCQKKSNQSRSQPEDAVSQFVFVS